MRRFFCIEFDLFIFLRYVHRSRRFDNDDQSPSIYDSYLSNNKSETSPMNSHKSSISSNNVLKPPYSFHLRRHNRSYIQKRKVTIVLIFCLFVALLLWTPQSLSLTYETLIESYSEMSPEHRTILLIFNNFANLFLCINASIDFILYCFLSEKFARTCRQILWHQCSNYKLNADQRSRIRSLDRTSFILTNTSNNIHQQQQQLAAKTTNNYYTQFYHFYRQSSNNSKNKNWKQKFVRSSSTTPPPNYNTNNRMFYRTSLIEYKQKNLNPTKNQQKSIENLSNTEDDINGTFITSISSNRQSRSNTISNI